MAAFNFQPIIQPGQVAQGVNDDFNRRQAVLNSITSGIGDLGKSIEKLGEWKKTMDERDERLAIKNGIVDKQNAARGAYDAINGEQFDVNSVDRSKFVKPATEGGLVVPQGAIDKGDGIYEVGGVDVDTSVISADHNPVAHYGFSFSDPTAESFDDEGYNAAVEKARGEFDADKAARLAEAKNGVDSYGWNDSENPAVQTAWEEYVRNGNSTLLANLQSQHNAELTRKALEAKTEAEKNTADKKALEDNIFNLGQAFKKAYSTYQGMKTENSENGKILAMSGKNEMDDAIDRLERAGVDASEFKKLRDEAVGKKLGQISSGIQQGQKNKELKREKALSKWKNMLPFEKAKFENDFESFLKEYN